MKKTFFLCFEKPKNENFLSSIFAWFGVFLNLLLFPFRPFLSSLHFFFFFLPLETSEKGKNGGEGPKKVFSPPKKLENVKKKNPKNPKIVHEHFLVFKNFLIFFFKQNMLDISTEPQQPVAGI